MKKQKSKTIPRNNSVVAARFRTSAGPMKHRLEPRKGAKNDQAEFLKEIEPELCPSCGRSYSKELSFCSNGFHCCRDCIWDDGKIIQRCQDHLEIENDTNEQDL